MSGNSDVTQRRAKWSSNLEDSRAARIKDLASRIDGKVVVVGSLNADLTVVAERLPSPGETVHGGALQILPGGKSSNQAATCAKLGARTTMIGAVGKDGNGELLISSLDDLGADTSHVKRMDVPTGTAMITVDEAGENTIVISPGANGEVTAQTVQDCAEAIAGAAVLGLCLEIPMDAIIEAARIAHGAGTTVVLNLSPYGDVPDELLRLTDILIVNEHELAQVTGIKHSQPGDANAWDKAEDRLREFGIETTVVTLGGEGAYLLERGKRSAVAPLAVDVVDTTGCGDSFMGTLMAALASDLTIEEGAELASVVSAIAATAQGAQSSYIGRDELLAL